MDYSVEYRKNKMPMEIFRQRYQDKEKYIAYCRECPRYDTVWSCPPLNIDLEAYLSRFEWINVVGAKINLERHVIEDADTADKIKDGCMLGITVGLVAMTALEEFGIHIM